MKKNTVRCGLFVIVTALLLTACQSTYYAVWEKLGKEKRHLLRDEIESTRDDQKKASETFKDALTRLKEVYHFDGGDLEAMYERLSDDYEDCRRRAAIVEERIASVERIASDLFTEWNEEIGQIGNTGLKTKSRQKLKQTQARYARLEKSLHTSRQRMTPVLKNMNDYVLYLKHNLNAQAIGVLKTEAAGIEADVNRLIKDINASVKEADAFLAQFEK